MRNSTDEHTDKVQGTDSGVKFNAFVKKLGKFKKPKNTVKTPIVKK